MPGFRREVDGVSLIAQDDNDAGARHHRSRFAHNLGGGERSDLVGHAMRHYLNSGHDSAPQPEARTSGVRQPSVSLA
jgi:hypothetical protein